MATAGIGTALQMAASAEAYADLIIANKACYTQN